MIDKEIAIKVAEEVEIIQMAEKVKRYAENNPERWMEIQRLIKWNVQFAKAKKYLKWLIALSVLSVDMSGNKNYYLKKRSN